MKFLRKKRVFAVLLLLFLVLLSYNTDMIGRWMYPIHYRKDIEASADIYHINAFFMAAIIRVESKYDPELVSKKGAIGLMQLMPDTAKWIVEKNEFAELTMDRLRRPDVNIHIGAWYLDSLSKQFTEYLNGKEAIDKGAIIAAAYNAGPTNALKWLKSGRWNGKAKDIKQIPFGETRHYVQRVLYYYRKYIQFYSVKDA